METINITLNKKTEDESNGGPVHLTPSFSTPIHQLDYNLQTLRKEELLPNTDTPTPESTPSPPHIEEKKTRWGLGRKKKDKK